MPDKIRIGRKNSQKDGGCKERIRPAKLEDVRAGVFGAQRGVTRFDLSNFKPRGDWVVRLMKRYGVLVEGVKPEEALSRSRNPCRRLYLPLIRSRGLF